LPTDPAIVIRRRHEGIEIGPVALRLQPATPKGAEQYAMIAGPCHGKSINPSTFGEIGNIDVR
jgi:hypothetical protein